MWGERETTSDHLQTIYVYSVTIQNHQAKTVIILCYIVIFITEMFSSLSTVFDGNCNHLMCTREVSDITAAYTN